MRNNDFNNENLAIFDPYKTVFKMSDVANDKKNKKDIPIMPLLFALHINSLVTNSQLPVLPKQARPKHFSYYIINCIKHIVMALTRQIRQFLTVAF